MRVLIDFMFSRKWESTTGVEERRGSVCEEGTAWTCVCLCLCIPQQRWRNTSGGSSWWWLVYTYLCIYGFYQKMNKKLQPGETCGIHVNSASFPFKTRGNLAEFRWFVRWAKPSKNGNCSFKFILSCYVFLSFAYKLFVIPMRHCLVES